MRQEIYKVEFLYEGKWHRSFVDYKSLKEAKGVVSEVLKNYSGVRIVKLTIEEEIVSVKEREV